MRRWLGIVAGTLGRGVTGDVGGGRYRAGVKQVVKVRMLPIEAEATALDATLRACAPQA